MFCLAATCSIHLASHGDEFLKSGQDDRLVFVWQNLDCWQNGWNDNPWWREVRGEPNQLQQRHIHCFWRQYKRNHNILRGVEARETEQLNCLSKYIYIFFIFDPKAPEISILTFMFFPKNLFFKFTPKTKLFLKMLWGILFYDKSLHYESTLDPIKS